MKIQKSRKLSPAKWKQRNVAQQMKHEEEEEKC